MIVLSLDPSSKRTGYAVLDDNERVVEAGYLTPARQTDPSEQRIGTMVKDLVVLLDEIRPDTVIIEVPSGLPGAGHKAGAKARLAIYGVAVGEIRRACKQAVSGWGDVTAAGRVVSVTERQWTRGVSKPNRQRRIARLYPAYARAVARDGGADVSDAIGLGLWWMGRAQVLGPSGLLDESGKRQGKVVVNRD